MEKVTTYTKKFLCYFLILTMITFTLPLNAFAAAGEITVNGAATTNTQNKIKIVFNGISQSNPIKTDSFNKNDFAVAINQENSVTDAVYAEIKSYSNTKDGINLTLDIDLYCDSIIKVSYTPGSLADSRGNLIAGFTNLPVTNGLPVTPTATPSAGAVAKDAEVTLRTASPGATIYYTVDGSEPNENSLQYTTPITIDTAKTIKAIATLAGDQGKVVKSRVLTQSYTIQENNNTINPTTANFDKYTSKSLDVTVTPNGDNKLTSILNNGTPLKLTDNYTLTNNSCKIKAEYLKSLPVGTTTLIFDFDKGNDPTLTITITDSNPAGGGGQQAQPTTFFSSAETTNTQNKLKLIFTNTIKTVGAKDNFTVTVDGTSVTIQAVQLNNSGNINLLLDKKLYYGQTIRVSYMPGTVTDTDGGAVAAFTNQVVTNNLPAAPTADPAAGTVAKNTQVSLTSPSGANIYYTLDGSTPSMSSTEYSGPITLEKSLTIKAIVATGGPNNSVESPVLTAAYTVKDDVSGTGAALITSEDAKTEGDKALQSALEKTGEARISLTDLTKGTVQISPGIVNTLANQGKAITVEGAGVTLNFGIQSLNTSELQKAQNTQSNLELGIKEVTASEKNQILAQAKVGEASGLFEVGGKVFDLTAQLVNNDSNKTASAEKIKGFTEPVAVTIDLANANLTSADLAKLTGIRYEKAADGSITPVKLGGNYDPQTKTFTFYTDKFSLYGVLQVAELNQLTLKVGDNKIEVNQQTKQIDTPPTIMNSRTMVPIRVVAEGLGAKVDWQEDTQTVTITMQEKVVTMAIGKTGTGLDTPPVIVNSRVLVPLRYVSETLGSQVMWFPATGMVQVVR